MMTTTTNYKDNLAFICLLSNFLELAFNKPLMYCLNVLNCRYRFIQCYSSFDLETFISDFCNIGLLNKSSSFIKR